MTVSTESVRVDNRKVIEKVACRVYNSANQENLTDATWNKLSLNTRSYDLGGNWDTTNFKFTAPVTGLYKISGQCTFVDNSVITASKYALRILKNGATESVIAFVHSSNVHELSIPINDELFLNEGDYIEFYVNLSVGANTVDVLAGTNVTYFLMRLINKEGVRQVV